MFDDANEFEGWLEVAVSERVLREKLRSLAAREAAARALGEDWCAEVSLAIPEEHRVVHAEVAQAPGRPPSILRWFSEPTWTCGRECSVILGRNACASPPC